MPLTSDQKLQNPADLTVKIGVGLQPSQRLLIRAPIENTLLMRAQPRQPTRPGRSWWTFSGRTTR